ncbi:chloramphenicol resistance protein [Coniochaeta ligniaria NRRL 30616]|uniref:Chloramphenicol resistance protein n=1 Tax=Coniochaeta ligniaria NRRL 30616 TaxID=1408157 RepID=A0A1J7IZM7_9PEZI|nr:chloramphenicol resistance protein [Coniochaeta ligniaria NRRL 30616]
MPDDKSTLSGLDDQSASTLAPTSSATPTPSQLVLNEKSHGGVLSNDDSPDEDDVSSDVGTAHPERDPEAIQRVPSGPAYSSFSKPMKRWIIAMVSISSFVSPMTANIYFPALNPIANDLGVSINLINLTLTTYMILQGIAPTLFGDFGDMAGRRPAFIVAFTIYFFANLGLALQDKYAALMVLRMMQSAGSSGTLALGYAVVADVAVSGERGKYMGIVGAGINVGPAISPVLGGILSQYLGWRAIFWFCLIFTACWIIPYVLFVPETCRKVVGNGSIPPQRWNRTVLEYVRLRRHPPVVTETVPVRKLRFPNPLRALGVVFEKDLSIILFYNTMIYLCFILVTATLSTQFKAIYGLNDLQIGLCYLPYGLGCCVAAVVQGYILDWNYRRIASKIGFTINLRRGDDLAKFPIEKARLQPMMPMTALGVCALICYGWVLNAETSLAGPLVLLFVIGLCVTGSFSILSTLVVDLYPEAPATAVAANNLCRCLFGAGGTAVIETVLRAWGRGWTFTFLALLIVVFAPIMWVSMKWGPKWREARRLRKLKEKEVKEEKAARKEERAQAAL